MMGDVDQLLSAGPGEAPVGVSLRIRLRVVVGVGLERGCAILELACDQREQVAIKLDEAPVTVVGDSPAGFKGFDVLFDCPLHRSLVVTCLPISGPP